jgi:hypothetical protein
MITCKFFEEPDPYPVEVERPYPRSARTREFITFQCEICGWSCNYALTYSGGITFRKVREHERSHEQT